MMREVFVHSLLYRPPINDKLASSVLKKETSSDKWTHITHQTHEVTMFRFHFLLLLFFGALASFAAAGSAPIFCKCSCSKNSTLIELPPQSTCAACTHAYCLSQDLPFCKDANNANVDVLSTCIQRDSRKDQIIVWGFILGTTGLLGWAAFKRVSELRANRKNVAAGLGDPQNRGAYAPVLGIRG
ncbi:hypothetical protein HD806DRAFT_504249 [Xylariaceae sp. AK1471]|nr:hypothetical protein HD806DRAFT_504249 [Xylariaceae sp. AK1471]